MVGTVESASTVVSAGTHTWRVVGGDDMTGCGGAATVETCHMAVSVIAQLHGQRVAGGGRLGRLEFCGCLGTGRGRRGHVVDDATLGIGSVQPRAVDSCLMQ
jgi:acyl CoA:acetate/3-ketoacid CoA transferase beta subunit